MSFARDSKLILYSVFLKWQLGVSLSAAARSAAADKLTPKNRPECNRTNDELKPPFPNGRHKKNTQRQKCPPRKGVRADPLADRLFLSRRAGFRCSVAACLFVIPPLPLSYCG